MDLYNLPDLSQKVQIFYTSGVWHKPRGISMVYIHAVGGGGGGSGGGAGAAGTSRNGGGGGACGNTSKLTIPAILLSDSLEITVGAGGLGGASNSSGTGGGITQVFLTRSVVVNVARVIIASGGAGAVTTTGGVVQAANQLATQLQASMGVSQFVGNQAGANGGVGALVGTSVFFGNTPTPNGGVGSILLSSGAGGGGCGTDNVGRVGGSITSTPLTPLISGGTQNGGDGIGGFISYQPMITTGGSGGGSFGTGTGGRGGNGNIGSGGGGGGAGVTGGAGGNGGNGMVLIVCW